MSNGTAAIISDKGDRDELLSDLNDMIDGTMTLKITCEQKNDQANASKYSDRLDILNDQYTKLSDSIWENWIGDAATVKADMKSATKGVDDCVKQIQQNVNTAQAIIKGLVYVDKAIEIAAKLLPL
jgi:hypothetical protein